MATKIKISDLYSAFSNPSGGAAGNPLAAFMAATKTPAPSPLQARPPISPFMSPAPVSPLTRTAPTPAAPAPNMSTVNGPVYAPPPSLSQVAAGAPSRPPVVAGPVVPVGPTGAAPAKTVIPVLPTGATGATGATGSAIPPQFLKADGTFKTPDEIAGEIGGALKTAHTVGDVGNLALDQFGGQNKSAVELEADARRIGNARNAIAVGEKDPYKVASESGIAYTAAELNAIEKAYAGVYDPALDTALAKVTAKQSSDKAKADADAQNNQPFTLGKDQVRYGADGKPIAVGISSDDGSGGGTYTAGANATVDAFVTGIKNGTYKASDIPDEYKGLVAQGVAATKPAISKSSNDAISVINEIEGSDILGQVSGIPNVSTFLPGTKAQTVLNLTKQLKGLLSLENRTQLKGSGAISDFEFRVLGDAASALGIGDGGRTNLSEEDFRDQLNKLKLKLQVGETSLTDDELLYLQDQGYTPDQIRDYNSQQSFSSVGNTTASTGNRPQRNNNPGNIKAGGLADSLATGKDDQGHLVFPDAAAGFKALGLDLTAKINGSSRYLPANPTISQLGKVYAEDPNWPKKVAMMLGVGVDTATTSVPFDKLVKAVATQEGFYA